MKYLDLQQSLKNFVLFSISDILKVDPEFHPQRLSEWQEKGYLKKVTKGYYTFADTQIDERVLFVMANKLCSPSYVSLETALSYYQIIPEGVYTVTSITSSRTRRLSSDIGQFSYTKVLPKLFFGYRLESKGETSFKIAEPEKAILDFLNSKTEIKSEGALEELRFNPDCFKQNFDWEKFEDYLKLYNNRSLVKRVGFLKKYLNHA